LDQESCFPLDYIQRDAVHQRAADVQHIHHMVARLAAAAAACATTQSASERAEEANGTCAATSHSTGRNGGVRRQAFYAKSPFDISGGTRCTE
jgi:hypothetical protein